MAWIYLAESEGSQRPWRPGCGQSPTVKTIDIAKPFSCPEWQRETLDGHRFGTTYGRSMDGQCVELTFFMEASPARTSALQAVERAWAESEAGYFSRSFASLARFDPDSCSWKIRQLSVLGEETLSPQNWPASGMVKDGVLYPLSMWERRTSERDGFFLPTPEASNTKAVAMRTAGREPRNFLKQWPTPRASDGAHGGPNQRGSMGDLALPGAVAKYPTPCARDYRTGDRPDSKRARNDYHTPQLNDVVAPGGQLNPTWVEWLMGYPCGWTVCEPWAMQWFRSKRGKRSKGSPDSTSDRLSKTCPTETPDDPGIET